MPRPNSQQIRGNWPTGGDCSLDPNSDTVGGSGLRFVAHDAGPSPPAGSEVPVAREYANVRIKGQGLADELHSTNETIRKAIKIMSADMHPTLEVCARTCIL